MRFVLSSGAARVPRRLERQDGFNHGGAERAGASIGEDACGLFHEIEKYADDNAGDLREMAFREKGAGRLSLALE